ncbi:MAG: RDD family protein [Halobacteriovoraceae bacterium]|nr:RDD family protein [Halobacteriovoraceae bacterium]
MKKNYLLKSSLLVARLARLIAKSIDIFIVIVLSFFFYPIGIILSITYIGISDSLQNGQSVGKRFMGLAVVSLDDGSPCSIQQSVVRNLPFLVPMVFGILPFWGWIFTLGLGVPLLVLEVYLIYGLDSGNRFGDVMADTTVMAINGDKVTGTQKGSWSGRRSRQNPVHDSIQ